MLQRLLATSTVTNLFNEFRAVIVGRNDGRDTSDYRKQLSAGHDVNFCAKMVGLVDLIQM